MSNQARRPQDVSPNQLAKSSTLSEDELQAVSAGVRKAGSQSASGGMFLRFDFAM